MEKLCNVLEMELKTYTPAGPKFVFEKIKFNILHIQHDFICQRLGFMKDDCHIFLINLVYQFFQFEIPSLSLDILGISHSISGKPGSHEKLGLTNHFLAYFSFPCSITGIH